MKQRYKDGKLKKGLAHRQTLRVLTRLLGYVFLTGSPLSFGFLAVSLADSVSVQRRGLAVLLELPKHVHAALWRIL